VGRLEELIPLASRCLKEGGDLFLWLSRRQSMEMGHVEGGMREAPAISLPGEGQGKIWRGKKTP
jgi:hypothetical protein